MKKGRWVWALLLMAMMALFFLRRLPGFVHRTDLTEQLSKQKKPAEGQADREKGAKDREGQKTGAERERKSPESSTDEGLSRNIARIIYTRHARCRMDCRQIDVAEVEEILQKGEINYQKSDLRSAPDPKYALEGRTHDGQHVRIVFANSQRGPVVITVIDLEKEWACNCK